MYLTHLCPVREISSGHLELPPQLLPHNCLLTVTPSASSDCEITLSNQHIIVKSRMRIKYTVVYLHCLCHLSIFQIFLQKVKVMEGSQSMDQLLKV